jgi:RNA polymerase sigma factor (sigma-70 family)
LARVQDSEDATQAVFLLLARWPGKVNEDLAGWLHSVARNMALTVIRSNSRRARREEVAARMRPELDSGTENRLREELDAALDRLPSPLRTALILCYLEGRTQQDAARILGTNQMMVSRRLSEGIERLRPILASRGVVASSVALVAFLAQQQASAAAPPAFLGSLKLLAAGGAATGAASALAQSTVTAMTWAKVKIAALVILGVGVVGGTAAYLAQPSVPSPFVLKKHGQPHQSGFFPIGVWLQNPANAAKYKAAGINLYVGLWKGPTDQQLADLKKHGLYVICEQTELGLRHKDDPVIAGWMHSDEPDNAQSLGAGKGYGPPIPPAKVIDDYKTIQAADPKRPIFVNFGQGVALDSWKGRGARTNHPEDYPEYLKGCDIGSFDIYPAASPERDVAGKLWLVADGVSRLRKWSGERKTIWNYIETTRAENPNAKATPQQVKAEVWMSLVRGSRGIIYYVHQFKPTFIEAALLRDDAMLAQVTEINRQINRLAPALNSPTIADGITVESSAADVPIEAMLKRHEGATYVFAVCMRGGNATASFRVAGLKGKVEVLDEGRNIEARDGVFRDAFAPWDVHLYKISPE